MAEDLVEVEITRLVAVEERDIPKTILTIHLVPADAYREMEHTRLGGRKVEGIHLLIVDLICVIASCRRR
jgi:hypothetical protein